MEKKTTPPDQDLAQRGISRPSETVPDLERHKVAEIVPQNLTPTLRL
jgi:hypothetical protein